MIVCYRVVNSADITMPAHRSPAPQRRGFRRIRGAGVRIPVRYLRRSHAAATILWALLVIPTILWWRDSVFWVALISVYANVVSHAGAWQASRAEDAAEN